MNQQRNFLDRWINGLASEIMEIFSSLSKHYRIKVFLPRCRARHESEQEETENVCSHEIQIHRNRKKNFHNFSFLVFKNKRRRDRFFPLP